MQILKIIGLVVIGIVSLFLLLILFIKIMVIYSDKSAIRKGRKYCEERGYKFKKVEIYPNHYGLFFIKNGMHFYASFDYERNGTFTWKKGSPEQKIAQRIEKKRIKSLEKKKTNAQQRV